MSFITSLLKFNNGLFSQEKAVPMPTLSVVAVLIILVSGCATLDKPTGINNSNQQIITVKPINTTQARLTLWENINGQWERRYGPIAAVVGRTGIALANQKREGDGHTPSGNYPLSLAFGYETTIKTQMNYRQATATDFWVDEVSSADYNRWVNSKPAQGSYEVMRRSDDLYRYGVVIDYNTNPIVPGNGSAIFLHVWKNYYKPTSGCVAISQRHLRNILEKLDRSKNPLMMIHKNPT